MANTLPFPAATPFPTRNAFWVFRAVAALAVIAVWLVVLLHLAMRVRAEVALGQIVREANAFAALPDVRATELRAFVTRRTELAGWTQATVKIVPTVRGTYQVVRIEIPTTEVMPRFLRPSMSNSQSATSKIDRGGRSTIASPEARTTWRSG